MKFNFTVDHVDSQWGFLDCGDPAILTTGMTYVDPSPKMGIQLWKFRTTCIKIGDQWEMCDFQEPLEHCESLEELLPGVIMPVPILTIMHRKDVTPEQCGIEIKGDFKAEPPVPPQVPEPPEVIDLPMEPREDQPPPEVPAAPPGVMLPGPGDDDVEIEGVRLGPTSTSAALKAACRSLGIGTSGSKAQLFSRLLGHMKCRHFEDSLSLEQAAKPPEHQPRAQSTPPTPSDDEVALHNLTHVPFRSWCPYCIACRSRRDRHQQGGESHVSQGGFPCIAYDLWYAKITGSEYHFMEQTPSEDQEVLTVLSVVDRSTGMCRGVPLPSKGHDSLVHAAKEIISFGAYLGYQTIEVRSDNEPAMESLTTMVVQARSKVGLRTLSKPSQPYEHATNGAAEQAVQTLRDLGITLCLNKLGSKQVWNSGPPTTLSDGRSPMRGIFTTATPWQVALLPLKEPSASSIKASLRCLQSVCTSRWRHRTSRRANHASFEESSSARFRPMTSTFAGQPLVCTSAVRSEGCLPTSSGTSRC